MIRVRQNAFTLIEILIVVIVMAVLAATVIPQFWLSTSDSKDSSLKFYLHTVRAQIELYKDQHGGKAPTLANFADQMTRRTDGNGNPGGANAIYGSYLQGQVPINPFNGSNALATVAAVGKEPAAAVAGGAGWQYDETTGGFFPNNAESYRTRK